MKAHGMPYGVRNVDGGVEFFIELALERDARPGQAPGSDKGAAG